MNVGEMQRKLSTWAEQRKEFQFFDLYHLLYDQDWLRLAHDYVAQNAGSITAGCDGINMNLFDEKLEENLQQLIREIKSETYEPYPVRRVYIPKQNGKLRPLGIPSIKDRIVQEALRMILEPIYETDFSQHSFGFRPNRCTMDAVKYIHSCTHENQKYFWVIEGDISSYFDTIEHRKLVKLIRRRVKDEKIIRLIWKFLRAGIMEGKLFKDTKLGTPQGGIVSPLLANIYLHELDRYMQKHTGLTPNQRHYRRANLGAANFIYTRYADDFVVLCNGRKEQCEEMKEELYQFLRNSLGLNLSKEKTKVTHINDGFKFLGFWIQRSQGHKGIVTKILIPEEAKRNIDSKIKRITSKSADQDSVATKILAINKIISGWCRYYQHTSKASSEFHKIADSVYWQMAHWLGRKFQLPTPQVIQRYTKDNTYVYGKYRLVRADEFKTSFYKKSVRKPNPYTMQQIVTAREEIAGENYPYWTGYERRPGITELRPIILERDRLTCQICEKEVTPDIAKVDHLKPVRRYKRPVDANYPDNLWTLCKECHKWKTENDRRMESRGAVKVASPVRGGV
jgi:RNA-directed DNA polymerase